MTSRARVAVTSIVTFPGQGEKAIVPWLTKTMQRAATIAREEANVDTGTMVGLIDAGVAKQGGKVIGVLWNGAEYGIWQELEPGEAIPLGGSRERPGGKAHLRPGVFRALQEAGADIGGF